MRHIYWALFFLLEFLKLYIIIYKIIKCKRNSNSLYFNLGLISFGAIIMFVMDVMRTNENIMVVVFSILLISIIFFMILKKKYISFIILGYIGISVIDVIIAGVICRIMGYNVEMALENKATSLIMNSVSLFILAAIEALLKKKKNKKIEYRIEYSNSLTKNIWLIVAGMIALVLYIVPIQAIALMDIDKRSKNNSLFGVTISSIIFFAICISNLVSVNARNKYEKQNKLYQAMLEQQKNYYESMLEAEKRTKKFRHDIINHLNCINVYLKRGEVMEAQKYLEEMFGKVENLKLIADTGNTTLNIVVNDVFRDAKNIRLNWKGSLPEEINILYIDICILFSNLLKNAVRATVKSDKEKVIDVELRILERNIYIRVRNPFDGEIGFKNGRPITTKKDKTKHGFGVLNIEEVVYKYNGSIEYYTDDGFVSEIVMENVIL